MVLRVFSWREIILYSASELQPMGNTIVPSIYHYHPCGLLPLQTPSRLCCARSDGSFSVAFCKRREEKAAAVEVGAA